MVVALTGAVPAQGLMLCLEPDGTLALELGFAESDCSGCPVPGSDDRPDDGSATGEPSCPCVDIPLVSAGELQLKRKTSELPLDSQDVPIMAPFARLLAPFLAPRELARTCAPRPPPDLVLLRTVVLLV